MERVIVRILALWLGVLACLLKLGILRGKGATRRAERQDCGQGERRQQQAAGDG